MQRSDVVLRLTPLFRNIFNDESIAVTDSLSAGDVSQWDSLTHMLLIAEVEKEFGFKFKLKDLTKMKNVGDMIDIILTKTQGI